MSLVLAIGIAVLQIFVSPVSALTHRDEQNQARIEINSNELESVNIFPKMYKIIDAENLLTINDIVAFDQSSAQKPSSLSGTMTNGTVWYIGELKNNIGEKIDWSNRIEFAGMVSADVYVAKNIYAHQFTLRPSTNADHYWADAVTP